ncbi:MAG: S9 family peptidase, partial [Phormidesmis sp. CAN_BIN44]|nr:S9 family peptidase [Phormidesmis sp. CAN_BIN44]
MTAPQSPYGSWKSPITSDLIVAGSIGLGQIKLDRSDIYWSESRPAEGGRSVIMQRSLDGTTERTPLPFNARTRVHEYGGGSFFVADGVVYFSNFADQRLYRQSANAAPVPLTSAESLRYADATLDPFRDRLICIREDHRIADKEAVNTIVAVPLGEPEAEQTILASGHDFYASPSLSPDGTLLSWISWNHPNMPWDGTDLWVAQIQPDGSLSDPQHIAGGTDESIFQPEWSPDGVLYFISDRTGWWNFYRWHPQSTVESVVTLEAEFGLPQWVFGMSTYGFAGSDQILCTYTQNGISHLATLDLTSRELAPISCPYTSIAGLQVTQSQAAFVGGSATEPSAIVRFDLASQTFEVLQRASELVIDPSYLSAPDAIEFPTENGLTAYALYYAPKNRDYTAPTEER